MLLGFWDNFLITYIQWKGKKVHLAVPYQFYEELIWSFQASMNKIDH